MLASALIVWAVVLAALTPDVLGDVSKHSVTWNTLLPEPGVNLEGLKTYLNSMPIGNGHVACNVNYESANDTLSIMIAASSSWAEDGEPHKVALLNINLPPRGKAALEGYSQTFNPQDATVSITIPAGASSPALKVITYVDANSDSVVATISPPNGAITASLVQLHPHAYTSAPSQDCQLYAIAADVVALNGSLVYHRNTLSGADSYMHKSFKHTNIPLVDDFVDPLVNRTTGVMVAAVTSGTATTFAATVLTAQTDTADGYESAISSASAAFVAAQTGVFPPPAHLAWWAAKWASHYIDITPNLINNNDNSPSNGNAALQVSQMYVWQRFIELSQARQPGLPIKFNGMLYVANRPGE
jgi:hypothetical protein